MNFEIALYPGDGIGPDVLEQAVRVMHLIGERHVQQCSKLAFHLTYEA